ncbi:MAG: SRPBCC domain-containing protein [Actinomycetota bacterium]
MSNQAAGTGELSFTRIFDAPRDLVFRCMTDPDHLVHFWGPAGVSAPREHITVDLRPGGGFETVMINVADGSQYPTRALYTEVVPPERLAWREAHSGMTVTVTFADLGDRTQVHIHQAQVPEMALSPQAQAGFATSLDRFAAYVRTAHETARSPR